jgi:agmatine deiminase
MTEKSYFMPPEWAKQKRVWLSWPQNEETWLPEFLSKCEKEYRVFAKELSEVVNTNILVLDAEHQQHVKLHLQEAGANFSNIVFHQIPTNDAWMRDHGPDFVWNVKNKCKNLLDWQYNSWGGKYPPFDDDNDVPFTIAENLNIPSISLDMVLEGGSFEVNGLGDLLTTKSCLLNENRNPELSQEDIEENLKHYFGVSNILWLEEGIAGDDTDGHIDDFGRFVKPKTIVYASTDDANHHDYMSLKKAEDGLKKITLADGSKPELIKIPMPTELRYEGEILPCSYANFLITNDKVLVPIFNCENDAVALSILQNVFEDRKVIGIPSANIIIGLGSLHCLSKHEFDESIFQ